MFDEMMEEEEQEIGSDQDADVEQQSTPPDDKVSLADEEGSTSESKLASGSTSLSTGNGASETSPEDVIREAIEIHKQMTQLDSNLDKEIDRVEAYLDLYRDKFDIDGDGVIRGEEQSLAAEYLRSFDDLSSLGDRIEAHQKKLAEELSELLKSHSEVLSKVSKLDLNAEQIVRVSSDMIKDGTFDRGEAAVLIAIIAEIEDPKEKIGDPFHELVVNGLGKLPCDLEPHQYQRLDYNCVPTTAKMLLERLGTNVSEGAVTVQAILDGFLTEEGMPTSNIVDILKRFGGHEAGVIYRYSPEELLEKAREYIDKGHLVAIPVDQDELSRDENGEYKDDDGPEDDERKNDGGFGSDHAVWVTDIDDLEVHIHDPGRWYGKDNIHPREDFLDAVADPHGTVQLELQNPIEGVPLPVGPVPIYYIVVTKEPAPPLDCEVPLSEMDQAQQRVNLQPN